MHTIKSLAMTDANAANYVSVEPMLEESDPMLQGQSPREVQRQTPKMNALGSVLLKTILVTGVLCGAYFAITKSVTAHDFEAHGVDVLNNAFVSYVGTVPNLKAHNVVGQSAQIRFPLCAPEIVAAACEAFNNETTETYNNILDARLDVIHLIEISEALMVHKSLVVELFEKLKNDPKIRLPMLRDEATEKAVVCMDLCRALVASYPPLEVSTNSDVGCYKDPNDGSIKCDVNLSPAETGSVIYDIPHSKQKLAYGESTHMKNFDRTDQALNASWTVIGNELLTKVPAQQLLLENVDVDDLRMALINRFRIWPVTAAVVQKNTATKQFFGITPSEPSTGKIDAASARRLAAEDWRTNTLVLAIKAKAQIVQALTAMNGRTIGSTVTKWFGDNTCETARGEIKRVMAGVHTMLNNVDYVYPGDQCQPNTYAYVYPQSPWNKNKGGKYIFYLCDYYMKVGDGEKMETLTHEGSHHQVQLTDDTKWDGSTMYGRAVCMTVAQQCAAGNAAACVLVLRNADSYCYFINDAALASQGKTNPLDPAPAPAPAAWAPEKSDGGGAGGVMDSLR